MPSPVPTTYRIAEIRTNALRSAQGSNSRQFLYTFHYALTTTTAAPTKTALDTKFQSDVAVPLFAALNVTLTQQNNQIRFLDDAFDAFTSFTHTVSGGVSGDSMPSFNSAYISLRSAIRSKKFRGGKHLGPLSESDTSSGTADIFNGGALTNFGNVAAALKATLTDSLSNVWTPVVWSRKYRGTVYKSNPTVLYVANITDAILNKRIGRMRKREVISVF